MRIITFNIVLLLVSSICGLSPDSSFSSTTSSHADPDLPSSGLCWTAAFMPHVKVGGTIPLKRFTVGAMLETRNEERFNPAVLPNHNWRGIGVLEILLLCKNLGPAKTSTHLEYIHESAHATMGIYEPTASACEMIYDDSYRRMNLNSASVHIGSTIPLQSGLVKADAAYRFYFLSKNTPELPGGKLTTGNGLSLGIEWFSPIGKRCGWFASLHNRLIFKSAATDLGSVYKGNNETLTSTIEMYPVINNVYTYTAKAGCTIFITSISRTAAIYLRFLNGNPYGYVDSRDIRREFSFGIELY